MCPICFTASTLLAWGSASTGGAAVLAAAWRFRKPDATGAAIAARAAVANESTEETSDEE